jgi:hypothetical protein
MAQAPYRLKAQQTSFVPNEETQWVFEVVGPQGHPTSYRMQHERELHLIVVRDDLSTFAHLHPTRNERGTWGIDLSLPKPGSYTAFADIAPDDEEPMTLRLPLQAEGDAGEDEVFEPSSLSTTDGYSIELVGDVVAGDSSRIEFRVTRNGGPVEPDPYLGAAGHLVAIHSGDLEYLHVHPMEARDVGSIPFMMHALVPGLYRLFLQFMHYAVVRTADFTIQATGGEAPHGSHSDA